MNPARDALLMAAGNRWLAEHLPRYRFVRATVRRFMPGERMEDALDAAARLAEDGIPATFTYLGENVRSTADADAVQEHYLRLLDLIEERGLDVEVSVKPTHLGLDLDPEATLERLRRLAERSAALDRHLFLDMESAPYVEPTLAIYRRLREEFETTGICIQAYLHRTPQDVADLLAAGGSIRLVKGAYREHHDVAIHDPRPDPEDVREARARVPPVVRRRPSRARDARPGAARGDRAAGGRRRVRSGHATRSRCSTASAPRTNAAWPARASASGC